MKNKILIIVLLVIIGGVVVWSMPQGDKLMKLKPRGLDNTDPPVIKLKIYQNKEVGIFFQYPDIFERVDMRVVNGEMGRKFTGVLELAPNHWISFGGVTKDYSASKGGDITDTHGYEKQGEKYAIKFVWGNQDVIPSEFWLVNSRKDQAIVVQNTEIEQILSRESIAAFVNIPDSSFPGIVFETTPVDKNEIEMLRQIVSSITFVGNGDSHAPPQRKN